MRKLILTLIVSFAFVKIANAAFGIFQTYSVPTVPQITCNLVTGVASVAGPCTSGATCNGVTDTAPAFKAFNTWANTNQGSNQVVLTIPAGSTCFFNSVQSYPLVNVGNAWTSGIKNLIVEGTGATITSIGGSGFYIGGRWGCQNGLTSGSGCSARLASANIGDTVITLTADSFTNGYISRFTAGKMVMIGGLDVQGLFQVGFGYPPNNTYFEWKRIVSTCNNTGACLGTATITLDTPLTNAYLSTWPTYNTGSATEADAGGSATVWAMPDSWDVTQEFRGLTINQTGQINGAGRNITYRDVFFTGASGNCGAFPSQAETWTAINTNWDQCVVENDKFVSTVTYTNITAKQLDWQSNSIARLIISNSTITTMFGAGRDTTVTDTSFGTLRPGSYTYGDAYKFVCTRCAVTTYNAPPQGGVSSNLAPPSAGPNPYTMSGGVISWPANFANSIAQGWSSPIGVPIFFKTSGGGSNNYSSIGVFSVTGVSGGVWPAADNQIITTNVTMDCTLSPKNLTISTSSFASGDVGKVIIINGARSGGPLPLRTYITAFNSATNVDVYDACSNSLTASSQTVQWGTAYVNVQTNQAGGFPNLTSLGNSYIQFASSQAPQFTCDSCTGDPVFTSMNIQNGATALAPIASFAKRTYTTQAAASNVGDVPGTGKLVSLTIDVTQAYTGSGAGTLLPTGQFHNYTVNQSTWTQFDWLPTINAKQAGKRVITPGGVTCDTGGGPISGGCAGDTINSTNGFPPNAVWVQAGISPSLSLAGSGGVNPTFTLTLQTDQTP